jgi:hypothetical protein
MKAREIAFETGMRELKRGGKGVGVNMLKRQSQLIDI